MMYLIGYKGEGLKGDKLIKLYSSSWKERFNGEWRNKYSHTEVLFSNDMMFSASQYEGRVRFKPHKYNEELWDYIPLDYLDESIVKKNAYLYEGLPYDYLGVFGFLAFGIQDPRSWFCSEVCAEILGIHPTFITPQDLMQGEREVIMSWFNSLLGTGGVVEGIREGVDKSILTPEERLDYQKELLKAYEPFKLIQRGLAFATTGMFGLVLIIELVLAIMSKWIPSTLEIVNTINNLEMVQMLGYSWLSVMSLYFTGGVINSFKGK
jgi:hypothetical protein